VVFLFIRFWNCSNSGILFFILLHSQQTTKTNVLSTWSSRL
jgi:hypothetical protein